MITSGKQNTPTAAGWGFGVSANPVLGYLVSGTKPRPAALEPVNDQ
tara:strand:- start:1374 stop:1511 length:138 start_codon:yes stop_codon:yes gene_type:complete